MSVRFIKYLILFIFVINLNSCTNDDEKPVKATKSYSNKVAVGWFDILRELTKTTPGFSPPVASRAFAYSGIVLYQTVLGGMPNYYSLEEQLNELKVLQTKAEPNVNYAWDIAANAAMANIARLLYPTATDSMKNLINTLESSNLAEFGLGIDQNSIDKSIELGIGISNEIFEWSKTDGGHEGFKTNFPSNYVVPQGPGFWVPTSTQTIPLQPFWGNNRNLVPGSASISQPSLTITYSDDRQSDFFKQALEVYTTSENLTPEQILIAKYWSDDAGLPGTPPGHSISVLTQILKLENSNLAVSAEMYAKLGVALSDAFLSCWKCKYTFNLIRPVSYINNAIDPSWKTLLTTPPFPEFTSGHSSQSGAFSFIMTEKFGDNYSFTDYTHESRTDIDGTPRKFSSFKAMADEAAISRLYGGIHFREAIETGLTQGEKVAKAVSSIRWVK